MYKAIFNEAASHMTGAAYNAIGEFMTARGSEGFVRLA
jgi:hypothetical protein